MKIYTRKGDKGKTGLLGESQVDKDSPRIEAYGTVDETNCVLGVAALVLASPKVKSTVKSLQNDLFIVGADLANVSPNSGLRIQRSDWERLEAWIDDYQKDLPELRHFILPGGSPGAARLHLARSVCRRAERLVVRAMKSDPRINPELLIYLNRLSDLLFVLARFENTKTGGTEEIWRGKP
ncbi:MAG: cob(I)yrinic acid a,c-diamide adenosyltransferase [Acidobacteriota bacterium]